MKNIGTIFFFILLFTLAYAATNFALLQLDHPNHLFPLTSRESLYLGLTSGLFIIALMVLCFMDIYTKVKLVDNGDLNN